MKKITLLLGCSMCLQAMAQDKGDTLARAIAISVLKTYPVARPFNIEYDLNGGDHYLVRLLGKDYTQGKIKSFNTVRASANLPILLRRKLIMTTTLTFNGARISMDDHTPGAIDRTVHSNIVGMAISGIWKDSLWNKLLIVTGSAITRIDFGNTTYVVSGVASAILSLKATVKERMGVGLSAMIGSGSIVPIIPLFSYYRRLSPTWELNVLIPNGILIRKNIPNVGWISGGAEMATNSLLGEQRNTFFNGSYETSFTSLRSGLTFERFLNRFMLIGIKGGVQSPIQARMRKIYTSNKDYVSEIDRRSSPYLNVSLSFIPLPKSKKK